MHSKNVSIFNNIYNLQSLIKLLFSLFLSTLSTCSQGPSFSWPLLLCVDPVGTQSFVSRVERQPGLVELKDVLLSPLGSTPADLHFHMFPLQLVRVFCVFCVEFFKGLFFRSLGTKVGLLLLPPTLNVLSVSVCANKNAANSQKNPLFTFTITLQLFRIQLPHLHKCCLSLLNCNMTHR